MKQINKKHTDNLLLKAKRRYSPEMYSTIKEIIDYILLLNDNEMELYKSLKKMEETADDGK